MTTLLWLAIETTDPSPRKGLILEVAVAFSSLATPFDISASDIQSMQLRFRDEDGKLGAAMRERHTKSGLLDRCTYARHDIADADASVADAVGDGERVVLAGSRAHFDRLFLRAQMPRVADRLARGHYDVSSIAIFCQSLGMEAMPPTEALRAGDKIRAWIAQGEACRDWVRAQGASSLDAYKARIDALQAERDRRVHQAALGRVEAELTLRGLLREASTVRSAIHHLTQLEIRLHELRRDLNVLTMACCGSPNCECCGKTKRGALELAKRLPAAADASEDMLRSLLEEKITGLDEGASKTRH